MKRSNHKSKKGDKPVVGTCAGCGKEFHSKYERKNHVCAAALRDHFRRAG